MDPHQPNPLTLQDFIQAINTVLTTTATSASASPMARPTPFSGDTVNCSGFILQCSLYFEMQPRAFPTERSKIAFMITLLTGRALQWAESLWNSDSPVTHTLDAFTNPLKGSLSGRQTQSYLYKIVCSVSIKERARCGTIPFYFAPSPPLAAGTKLPSSWTEFLHSPADGNIWRHGRAGNFHLQSCPHFSTSHGLWRRLTTCSTATCSITSSSTRTHAGQFQPSHPRRMGEEDPLLTLSILWGERSHTTNLSRMSSPSVGEYHPIEPTN